MPTKSLPALLREIRSCRICEPDLPEGANPVLRARKSASILIAGQAPGIRVHQSSTPFNDPSGDRLRKWMGIDHDLFYNESRIAIVPMGFCFPGSASRGDLPPRKECSQTWHAQLLGLLPNIKLTLVIGIYAQAYYLGANRKSSLTETVKAWKEYGPSIIPLPHPSPRNNIWLKKNPWFETELLPVLSEKVSSSLA
ncbi:MAG: uracil-DNA glycosylase family protein [Acidiferrobacterales bacterium]|nr:uracil-DNA glycosylase family protein [Acidiferrobacterales bacterium]